MVVVTAMVQLLAMTGEALCHLAAFFVLASKKADDSCFRDVGHVVTSDSGASSSELKAASQRILTLQGEIASLRRDLAKATIDCSSESSPTAPSTTIAMLRAQLRNAGLEPLETTVSLDEAKGRLRAAVEQVMAGEEAAHTEVEKWDSFVRAHPVYAEERAADEARWEAQEAPVLASALAEQRGFVPIDISFMSVNDLCRAGAPRPLAKRLLQKRILWLLRRRSAQIAKIHAADLYAKYAGHGLDLTELRAVWAVVATVDFDDASKQEWRADLRTKLRYSPPSLLRHTAYHHAAPFVSDDAPEVFAQIPVSGDHVPATPQAANRRRHATALTYGDERPHVSLSPSPSPRCTHTTPPGNGLRSPPSSPLLAELQTKLAHRSFS